ncbi:MAG: hypothetical protein ACK4PI_03065 [Tepidisphaerales bacterium]
MVRTTTSRIGVLFLSLAAFQAAPLTAFASLVNPGFELDDASAGDVAGATGWGGFNARFTTATVARTGNQSLKIFGPFFPFGGSGATQRIPTAPGELVDASVWALNAGPAADGLVGDNFGLMQVQFYNAAGATLGPALDSTRITAASPVGVWQQLTVLTVAPPDAAFAEILLLHVQLNNPVTGGSVFFDDASLTSVIPEPSVAAMLPSAALLALRRRRRPAASVV